MNEDKPSGEGADENGGAGADGSDGATGDAERHKAEMQALQAEQRAARKARTLERGLLLVHTGNGKGKSSAAFGMAIRSLGWGMNVGIVQYVKGAWQTGEKRFFKAHPELLTFEVMGEGFTWDTQDRERDIAAARAAWERSKAMIADPEFDFVILDELNIVLRNDTLPLEEIVATLAARPLDKHVCITGRDAPEALREIADLVTVIDSPKHPYEAGFKAQKGVEY